MISVSLNGEETTLAAEVSLREALHHWGYQEQNFAVAVNACFVARQDYQATQLKSGDRIDLVAPMQGG